MHPIESRNPSYKIKRLSRYLYSRVLLLIFSILIFTLLYAALLRTEPARKFNDDLNDYFYRHTAVISPEVPPPGIFLVDIGNWPRMNSETRQSVRIRDEVISDISDLLCRLTSNSLTVIDMTFESEASSLVMQKLADHISGLTNCLIAAQFTAENNFSLPSNTFWTALQNKINTAASATDKNYCRKKISEFIVPANLEKTEGRPVRKLRAWYGDTQQTASLSSRIAAVMGAGATPSHLTRFPHRYAVLEDENSVRRLNIIPLEEIAARARRNADLFPGKNSGAAIVLIGLIDPDGRDSHPCLVFRNKKWIRTIMIPGLLIHLSAARALLVDNQMHLTADASIAHELVLFILLILTLLLFFELTRFRIWKGHSFLSRMPGFGFQIVSSLYAFGFIVLYWIYYRTSSERIITEYSSALLFFSLLSAAPAYVLLERVFFYAGSIICSGSTGRFFFTPFKTLLAGIKKETDPIARFNKVLDMYQFITAWNALHAVSTKLASHDSVQHRKRKSLGNIIKTNLRRPTLGQYLALIREIAGGKLHQPEHVESANAVLLSERNNCRHMPTSGFSLLEWYEHARAAEILLMSLIEFYKTNLCTLITEKNQKLYSGTDEILLSPFLIRAECLFHRKIEFFYYSSGIGSSDREGNSPYVFFGLSPSCSPALHPDSIKKLFEKLENYLNYDNAVL